MSEDSAPPEAPTATPSPPEPSEPAPVRLRCQAGGALPEDLARDAERLRKLSAGALQELGQVLRPTVLQPVTKELSELLSRFCLKHEIAEADLGHVLKVCRWLLREASALDLPTEALLQDVTTIWSEAGPLVEALEAEYEPLKRLLRDQLLTDALVKHGDVLLDVDWRLDAIVSERHAAKLGAAVALVTLAYRNAERGGRLTLQVTPSQLERLSQIFSALAQKMRLAAES